MDRLRPEAVLTEENRRAFSERFKLFKPPRKVKDTTSEAAVLVPICLCDGELGFLYTLRSMKLNSNRGQVSFPGGMRDKDDPSITDTALRESWEELKIPREKVEIWASGNELKKSNLSVVPIVGYIGEVDPRKLEVNADEVEEAFVVSLRTLCDPSLCRYTRFRDSFTLPVYLGGKHRIWGFTGAITHMTLSCLLPDVYKNKLYRPPSAAATQIAVESSKNAKAADA